MTSILNRNVKLFKLSNKTIPYKCNYNYTNNVTIRFRTNVPEWFVCMTKKNPNYLPRLPIPNLNKTKERYLKSLEPIVSNTSDLYNKHVNLINQFIKEEGKELNDELIEKDKINHILGTYPYSYIEDAWDEMYLSGRYELPIHVNPVYGLIDEPKKDNIHIYPHLSNRLSRISYFIVSFLKWGMKLHHYSLKEDENNNNNIVNKECTLGIAKQLGTARIPKVNKDELRYYPESKHIVVLIDNTFYKINVISKDKKRMITPEQLESQLKKIIQNKHEYNESNDNIINEEKNTNNNIITNKHNISICTSEKRNIWAKIRNTLEKLDYINKETLETIDSALTILVLDERKTSKKNISNRTSLTLHGMGKNRWFDKHQIISYVDGHIGINFEHSFSDGTVWNSWLKEVWNDMRNNNEKDKNNSLLSPLSSNELPNDNILNQSLKWKINNEIIKYIDSAEKKFSKLYNNVDVQYCDYKSYGKKKISKEWKVSPDAVVQIAYQLAFYNYHKFTLAPTYESCSTRHFLHGRTETIRSLTNELKDFVCSVDLNKNKNTINLSEKIKLKKLLILAINKHIENGKLAQQGQGIDRHLSALYYLYNNKHNDDKEMNYPISKMFFNDPLKLSSSHFRLSTSNVTMPFLKYFSFGPVVPDGYGLGYLIHDRNIEISATNFKNCKETNSQTMLSYVSNSLDYLSILLSHKDD